MSLSCIVNWVCNFIVGMSFPFMQIYMGPWCFGPFALVLVLVMLYTLLSLPETHGRTVEEIQRLCGGSEEEALHRSVQMVQAVTHYNLEEGLGGDTTTWDTLSSASLTGSVNNSTASSGADVDAAAASAAAETCRGATD